MPKLQNADDKDVNMKGSEIMTNKEVVERLKWVEKRICDITYSPESFEALEIAIKVFEEKSQDNLIQSLTELCNKYCKNCPIPDVPDDCHDCICTHIREIIERRKEE